MIAQSRNHKWFQQHEAILEPIFHHRSLSPLWDKNTNHLVQPRYPWTILKISTVAIILWQLYLLNVAQCLKSGEMNTFVLLEKQNLLMALAKVSLAFMVLPRSPAIIGTVDLTIGVASWRGVRYASSCRLWKISRISGRLYGFFK